MGKGTVLGNDPFERGAAAPDAVESAPVRNTTKRPRRNPRKAAEKRTASPNTELHEAPAAPPAGAHPDPGAAHDNGERQPTAPFSNFAMQMAGRALSMPAVQRAVQVLGSSPAFGRAMSAAARATGFVFRSPVGGAARALLPAARNAATSAFSGNAVSGLIATAASAAEAARRIVTTRTDPSDVDEFGEDPSAVERMTPVLDFLYERYWRVQVDGIEHIPEGPSIIVCNHSGALPFDGPMMRTLIRREAHRPEARWLVEDAIAHSPFMGVYLNRIGAVRACPENAERLLDKNVPLIVFPEGVNGLGKINVGWLGGQRYRLSRFGRGGFVKLALRKKVPIVPVAIFGAEDTLPLLAKIPARGLGIPYIPVTPTLLFPLPTQWSVRVLPPITLDGGGTDAEPEQLLVQRVSEEVRQTVQTALDDLVSTRR
jgi:1-acyl-sn-glycerol-3-phosphate acyltransferase